MGCDIHCYAERKNENGKFEVVSLPDEPFGWRSYGMFDFLAGVRAYSAITPISEPRGIPNDVSPVVKTEYESWDADAHTPSWLSVKELAEFDYEQQTEDRRYMKQIGPNAWDGGQTCGPGEGSLMTYREFLGQKFFEDLQKLKDVGAERIIFWFDN